MKYRVRANFSFYNSLVITVFFLCTLFNKSHSFSQKFSQFLKEQQMMKKFCPTSGALF